MKLRHSFPNRLLESGAISMSLGHFIRLAIIALIIVTAIYVFSPYILSDIRSNGVVNARLVTLRAPIDGMLVRDAPDVGTFVSKQQIIGEIVDSTIAMPLLAQLDTERDSLVGRISALKNKEKELTAVQVRLAQQIANFQTDSSIRLGFQVVEANARAESWRSVLKERELNLIRISTLFANGHAPKLRLETAQSLVEQANQEIIRAEADAGRLRGELEAVGRGIYLGDGRNDVPYSQQRYDEIVIALADLRVQIAETQSRLKPVVRQFQQEVTRSAKREGVEMLSPIDGTIWRRIVIGQVQVSKNDEITKIINCNTIFVEVPIPESMADDIQLGELIDVRLQGSNIKLSGKIQELRGPRSVAPNVEFAAAPPLLNRDQVLLVIKLTALPDDLRVQTFCNVGRRSEVLLPRISGWPALMSIVGDWVGMQ